MKKNLPLSVALGKHFAKICADNHASEAEMLASASAFYLDLLEFTAPKGKEKEFILAVLMKLRSMVEKRHADQVVSEEQMQAYRDMCDKTSK